MSYNRGSINQDLSSLHHAHVSHFGALKTASTIPVLKANFPGSSLDTTVWDETVVNGGTVTVGQGVALINTSTNVAGSAKLNTVEQGIFEAGQITVYQSGVSAGVGVANNIRIWGLMTSDEQDGLYFKLNGTTFQVVARAGGIETAVNSGSFNGDTSFTPSSSNNTYRIEYSAGRAIFYAASGGNKRLLHTMVDSDFPLVEDLNMGLYYENTNTGNSTDIELKVRGASSSIWGELPTTRANATISDDTVMTLNKRTLTVSGLDENWDEQTETFNLNGTTPVVSVSLWRRLNRAFVATAGSQNENSGIITIRHTTTTANVFISLPAEENQSTVAAYTVPANKKALLYSTYVEMGRAAGNAGQAEIQLLKREEGGVYRTFDHFFITESSSHAPTYSLPITFEEKTDILVRVFGVSDNSTTVSASLELMLVDQ